MKMILNNVLGDFCSAHAKRLAPLSPVYSQGRGAGGEGRAWAWSTLPFDGANLIEAHWLLAQCVTA